MVSNSSLTITLEIIEPVVVGLSVLAVIRVLNHGETTVPVSGNLKLRGGALSFKVTNPDGIPVRVFGAGSPPDTAPSTVGLEPAHQIIGCVNLLYTSVKDLFSEPGNYTIEAEYNSYGLVDTCRSEPVGVTARLPQNESESGVAELLRDDTVKHALTFAESDAAPDALRELADRYGETPDGQLARLVLADGEAFTPSLQGIRSTFLLSDLADPFMLALRIRAISTPFNMLGENLVNQLLAFIDNPIIQSSIKIVFNSASIERALRIIRGEPVEIE